MLALTSTIIALGVAQGPLPPPCSLNGELQGGKCVCDKPWSGSDCSTINFKPVSLPQGYGMSPNLTSWGGNALLDPSTGKYHIFVSAMTNECPLSTWGQNSRIEHGVADTITGPYRMVDVAIPTWSHNSAPVALKDGSYAIFHIGTGTGPPNGGKNCTPRSPTPPPPPPPPIACTGPALPGWTCKGQVCAGDSSDPLGGNCGADLAEPDLDCTPGDVAGCSAAAAKDCEATPGCTAFALSKIWPTPSKAFQTAKLFSSSRETTRNPDWAVWTKNAASMPQPWAGGGADLVDHGVVLGANSFEAQRKQAAAGGSTIHVAASLNGPWVPLESNHLGGCNNPAPWVHPNGTIYCLCGNSVLRAEHVSGPWTHVSSLSHSGGPSGSYEDPFLYTDSRGWHLIYHVYNTKENPPHGHECVNSTVSAHAFSTDGFTWHMSPLSPYGTQVELTTGGTMTVATRERPKLWFNSKGEKTHLFNGVCGAPNCPDGPATGCVDCKYANWDFTLVQPLDV